MNNINLHNALNSFLKEKLTEKNFKKADDRYTWILDIDENKSFLVCLLEQDGFLIVKYGIRPNKILNDISKIFDGFTFYPLENPFSKKWSSLFWSDLFDKDLINNNFINFTELNKVINHNIDKYIDICNKNDISYFVKLAWYNKIFDGLSKYTLPACALNEKLLDLSFEMENYFIANQPSDKIDAYKIKLQSIKDHFIG